MGFTSWYNGRIKSQLDFPGMPQETVRRDLDTYQEFGFTGFMIRREDEIKAHFSSRGDSDFAFSDYIIYLMERSDSLFPRNIGKSLNEIIRALSGTA